MRLIAAFLKLVRLPNLFFIALTQVLFQVCIYEILYKADVAERDTINFILLVAASLMIAAAGYIINDYFDINIDEVNKPGKMVVDRHIHRRWAIAWHFILSLAGIVLTVIAVPLDRKWYIILANIFCVILLWFYSTSLKRKLLIGNIVISLLTAWTVMVVFFSKYKIYDFITDGGAREQKFFRLALLYAGFAFIISLIREAIKDMEDMPGDAKYGCRTMPIAWGVNATKVYTAVWLVVLIAVLVLLQVYVSRFGWWLPVAYSAVTIILPLILVLFKLRSSKTSLEFHQLSNITKLVMFSGILSMIFLFLPMKKIILASQSPRRKQLLEWAEVPFEIDVADTDERFPPGLEPEEVAIYIARNKALMIQQKRKPDEIILAADTIVVLGDNIIGKPVHREDAVSILLALSGEVHKVITAVVIRQGEKEVAFADTTTVEFHPISVKEIEFYVDKYKPYDKAGAYAIQEWIGVVGIKSINGDFYNVMGLPVSRVVQALEGF